MELNKKRVDEVLTAFALSCRQGERWRLLREPKINDSGSWEQEQEEEMHIRVTGTPCCEIKWPARPTLAKQSCEKIAAEELSH